METALKEEYEALANRIGALITKSILCSLREELAVTDNKLWQSLIEEQRLQGIHDELYALTIEAGGLRDKILEERKKESMKIQAPKNLRVKQLPDGSWAAFTDVTELACYKCTVAPTEREAKIACLQMLAREAYDLFEHYHNQISELDGLNLDDPYDYKA